jgi:hypothetical protein
MCYSRCRVTKDRWLVQRANEMVLPFNTNMVKHTDRYTVTKFHGTALLQKLTVTKLVKKLLVFYRTMFKTSPLVTVHEPTPQPPIPFSNIHFNIMFLSATDTSLNAATTVVLLHIFSTFITINRRSIIFQSKKRKAINLSIT